MKRLIELLPSSKFQEVHKSFIVRLEAITAVNGNEIEIISKAKIPIGLQYRDLLMNILKNTD